MLRRRNPRKLSGLARHRSEPPPTVTITPPQDALRINRRITAPIEGVSVISGGVAVLVDESTEAVDPLDSTWAA
jgi:hypothetical protein